jgi:hypothetical protein
MNEDIDGIAQVETKMGGCVIDAIKKIQMPILWNFWRSPEDFPWHYVLEANATSTTLNEQAKSNLDKIEQDLETSFQYFKPKPGNTYVIKMDP